MRFRRQESFSSSEVVSMLSHPERALLSNQYAHMESLHSALEAGLWGTEEHLESQFFVLHFRQKDAPTVIKVAPRLDTLLTTISQNLGVTPLADGQKLIIEISVERARGQAVHPSPPNAPMIVTSPFLFALPDERAHEELLTQSIVLPLIDRILAETADQYQLGSTRAPMINALRLWQLWALDLPLAKWRPDVVRWIFVGLPTALPGSNPPLPPHYEELCADHALWVPNPAQLQIPLLCIEADQSAWLLASQLAHVAPSHLAPLSVLVLSDEQASAQRRTRPRPHPGETVALATLIEYVAAHFGREQLPSFVAALGQHESWATLTPMAFGHSVEEFEAGWQSYLQEHYLR
jgi:hypothetical protein